MKKAKFLSLIACLFMLTGCYDSYRFQFISYPSVDNPDGDISTNVISVGNSQTSEDDPESGGGGDSVYDKIFAKYDALPWEYNGGQTSITMAHWNDNGVAVETAVVNALLKGFNHRYPEIQVKVTYYPDYEGSYGTNLYAGTACDVILVPDGAFTKWGATGRLKDLQSLIDSSEILNTETIFDTALTRYQLNPVTKRAGSGNQLALPKDIGPQVMYYNRDIIDDLNEYASKNGLSAIDYPPNDRIMTMTEATNWWIKVKDYSRAAGYGSNFYPVTGIGPEGLVWSAGGDFLNANRDGFPGDTKGLEIGYKYIVDAYYDYEILPHRNVIGDKTGCSFFLEKSCASFISGRSDVSSLRGSKINWDIAYVPSFDNGEYGVSNANHAKNTFSGSVGYAIYSGVQATKLEAAWKLVEYIASKEGQEILSATGYQIPVYEDLAKDPDVIQREIDGGLSEESYMIFVESAASQSYGLWQYRASIEWKEKTYDKFSENLLHSDANIRKNYPVTSFLNDVRNEIGRYL